VGKGRPAGPLQVLPAPVPQRPREKRGEKALLALERAAKHTALADAASDPRQVCTAILERVEAKREQSAGEALLTPTGTLVAGVGEVVSWDPGPDGLGETLHPLIYSTLEKPNSASVEASQRRLDASLRAQVLEPAVDAAVSAHASNSIEKMFWHQMAAVHHHAMKHLERSLGDRLPPSEQVRYTNAAARLVDVYREGLLACADLNAVRLRRSSYNTFRSHQAARRWSPAR
jgi:hypothetical protein